ncbi:hypothetical protein [Butyrivibrio sp. AC2005]|uniref:hypothetical protein n=1 Tax=Butyrivibrio sp. AC2005 TaxID=1280672 RepID=UPI0004157EBC|nr:hypothetical protein [Butyrivibrio sp. AC2005]
MKKRIISMCFATSMSIMLIACGDSSNSTVETEKAVETQVEDTTEAEVQEENVTGADTQDSTEVADTEAGDDKTTDEEVAVDYSVFTSASSADVEAYAQKIVDATNAKDWDTIGDMIDYPIGSEESGNLCKNKEEFVSYANEKGFDEETLAKLQSWTIADLWANYQGASIGDGDIWFRDLSLDNPEFKIVSYLGLYEAEADGEVTD